MVNSLVCYVITELMGNIPATVNPLPQPFRLYRSKLRTQTERSSCDPAVTIGSADASVEPNPPRSIVPWRRIGDVRSVSDTAANRSLNYV